MAKHGLTEAMRQRIIAAAREGQTPVVVCANADRANEFWQGLPPGLPIKVVSITDDPEGSLRRQHAIEREQMRRHIIIDDPFGPAEP